jgi:hypothetical protein
VSDQSIVGKRKHSISVGDRVRVYGFDDAEGLWDGDKATVTCINESTIEVKGDHETLPAFVHPKQCRRLKKRERRRVWVKMSKNDKGQWCAREVTALVPQTEPGWVEFIEVRRG